MKKSLHLPIICAHILTSFSSLLVPPATHAFLDSAREQTERLLVDSVPST